MAKAIGPNFWNEIQAAGISGNGWAWGADGSFSFADVPQSTIDAINAVYAAHDPTVIPVSTLRDQTIDAAIAGDTTIAQLKAMNSTAFDAWWAANVTTAPQAIAVLKRVTRLVIRKLL